MMEQIVVLPIVNKRSKVGYDNYLVNLNNINYIREWVDDNDQDDKGKCCIYFNGSDKYLIAMISKDELLEFIKKKKEKGSD